MKKHVFTFTLHQKHCIFLLETSFDVYTFLPIVEIRKTEDVTFSLGVYNFQRHL